MTSISINAIIYTYKLLSEAVMSKLKQYTELTAKQNFNFKDQRTHQIIKISGGDTFVVTSPENLNHNTAVIAPNKGSSANVGFIFSINEIEKLFNIQ